MTRREEERAGLLLQATKRRDRIRDLVAGAFRASGRDDLRVTVELARRGTVLQALQGTISEYVFGLNVYRNNAVAFGIVVALDTPDSVVLRDVARELVKAGIA